MLAIAVNGSPRKRWNTATLLEHALAGAAEAGAETRLVHLYDLDYHGCRSCFACKKIGGRSYGRCAAQDGLTGLLEAVAGADVLLLGTPVYFRAESGAMRSFLERLLFPYLTYTPEGTSIFPGRLHCALFYTLNLKESDVPMLHLDITSADTRDYVRRVLGPCELMICGDTLQFEDYAKYEATRFDGAAKARRHAEVFPQECARAEALGAELVRRARADERA